MESTVIVLMIVVALAVAAYVRWTRDDEGERAEDEWGKPLDRWRDLDSIARYHGWKAEEDPGSTFLDDRTWSDLHLDLVFARVDRTRSTVGKQLLYHRLRSAPTPDRLNRFEQLVGHFATEVEQRVQAQRLLSQLSHAAGYRLFDLCREDGIRTEWWYGAFPLLGLTGIGSLAAYFFWPRALLVLLVVAVVNTFLRFMLSSRVFHLFGPFRQVGPLINCANEVLGDPVVSEILGAKQIQLDLRSIDSLRRTARWATRNSSMQGEIAGSTWEYLNLIFLFDANAMYFATGTLRKNGSSLLRIIELLGEVDAAISTASLRAGEEAWAIPEFTAAGSPTELTAAWHPLVESAVPNSVTMLPGRGLVITGSNMSGKSTFLRTVGVAVVLAQTLNTCPARAYSSPRLKLRSAIGRSDDLTAGKSFYLVEVDAVLDLLRDSTQAEPHLFLFDEIFRGTNTIERLATGEAVLKALPLDANGQARHIVIAATHDGELIELLEELYDPYHFGETVRPEGLSFDYELLPGPARTRTAIALLEIRGAPAGMVEVARARAAQLDAANERLPG